MWHSSERMMEVQALGCCSNWLAFFRGGQMLSTCGSCSSMAKKLNESGPRQTASMEVDISLRNLERTGTLGQSKPCFFWIWLATGTLGLKTTLPQLRG